MPMSPTAVPVLRPRGSICAFRPGILPAVGLLLDIYEDLGFYTKFDGLLFHDDAFLSDYEGPMPLARTPDALQAQGGAEDRSADRLHHGAA